MAKQSIAAFLLLAITIISHAAILVPKCPKKCPKSMRCIDGKCVGRCRSVCIKPECTAETAVWKRAMVTPCWQRERLQATGEQYVRTSCRCPTQEYDDELRSSGLSNCIAYEITQHNGDALSLGPMMNVAIWSIHNSHDDVGFDGPTMRSMICHVKSMEDVEIGKGVTFRNNFVGKVEAGDDFHIEEGAKVTSNTFVSVSVADKLAVNDENVQGVTVIRNNRFHSISAKRCDVEPRTPPATVIIKNNRCTGTQISEPDSCEMWDEGFSCDF